ncbi:pyruvate formate-lyase-activating protein [Pediococcus claussenii]|uniref:Pyruvate formate-lyase-activating enzyme n=1 Tax=Pediococcus claussenii (strain ATCC BAA-344 / DSM 14800 / JCM 18046 / KCTC 3811 / LMG 21948 / P06) TaxID=701521 RepID=G8PAC1_PEDCP|nr:pyruvate formate-lyase-activating protein [Pediococcus claussenii]AEV94560.1 pyruvate formate-lyase 1-activating enzyme [Pediococcus claussenii ATCC BAA-344]ANZ69775.1 pyruvate formate lyase-activating enzyme 1 [Pediococcus claussenii]ANZ71592.1 pyruvate formate lyase-activating enzyme 1 [Pediococcus claussenii]KRN19734.1 pflA protein [Pediococcus claussenii]
MEEKAGIKDQSETKEPLIGYVHSIETFGSVDGPGIRYVVFLQGCHMRCQYCHNPDTWKLNVGDKMTTDQILDDAEKYRAFWGKTGGITVSGGEALVQVDFVLELFEKAKERNISTCLDTAGQPFTREQPFFDKFERLMQVTDISLVDIKHINSKEHKKLTQYGNENILDMIQYMAAHHNDIWIRHVLVPQRTDYDNYLAELGDYIAKIPNDIVQKVEVLPYHTLGVKKYHEMKIKYRLEGIETPTPDRVANAEKLLHTNDYTGYRNWMPMPKL